MKAYCISKNGAVVGTVILDPLQIVGDRKLRRLVGQSHDLWVSHNTKDIAIDEVVKVGPSDPRYTDALMQTLERLGYELEEAELEISNEAEDS